jgi:hypothetical protein
MKLEVDTSEVMQMLDGIKDNIVKIAVPKAVNQTANQVRSSMVSAASNYKTVTKKTKGRWSWETYGRIPRAVTISAAFKKGKGFDAKGGDRGKKVFITVRKGVSESKRAPHWNLVVYGHRQMIPTGIPGKGQIRQSKRKPMQPGSSMFAPVAASALGMLKKNLVHQLKAAVKKSSQ